MNRLPSHAADLVQYACMAGPFSRLPLIQRMINGFLVAYTSSCTRWCAGRGREGPQ